MTLRRRILYGFLFIVAVPGAAALWYFHQLLLVGSAYTAKTVCAGVFIAKRAAESVLAEDVRADQLALLRLIEPSVHPERRLVTASFLGLAERTAIYREGLGCTLAIGVSEQDLRASAALPAPRAPTPESAWPEGEEPGHATSAFDMPRLLAVLDRAFAEPDRGGPRRTRAIVIVHDGSIVAERYAAGFSRDTAILGWSLSKSALNAIVGVLVAQGRLRLESNGLLDAWRGAGDPRASITLEQLLHMESGLQFAEDYANPLRDVIYMLMGTGDAAGYAAAKPLAAPPGTRWQYSSGTSNIIARVIRETIASDPEYLAFPRRALFDRIGMASVVMEPDAAGNLVASSFMHATPRDWARLGLLYLQDGMWKGERVLPEGWVKFSVRSAPVAPEGKYGAHFWLKLTGHTPGLLPPGAYHMAGHDGQFVTIVPEKKLVVVRHGLSRLPGAWDQTAFVAEVMGAIR